MNEKERAWKIKRSGIPTSSSYHRLLVKGSVKLTGDALAAAKAAKSRVTIDTEFGDGAMTYIRELVREVRRCKPTFHRDNFNFDWGHKQEPMAIAWLKHSTMLDIKSCSFDFDDIVFNISECGGDSPDFYVGEDGVGEIKCPVSESLFEKIKEHNDKWLAIEEYSLDQLAGHAIGMPSAKKVYFLVYDGQNDDDEMDTLSPLDPDRGVLFEFTREELEPKIQEIKAKVPWVRVFIKLVVAGKAKVGQINEYWDKYDLCSLEKLVTD